LVTFFMMMKEREGTTRVNGNGQECTKRETRRVRKEGGVILKGERGREGERLVVVGLLVGIV